MAQVAGFARVFYILQNANITEFNIENTLAASNTLKTKIQNFGIVQGGEDEQTRIYVLSGGNYSSRYAVKVIVLLTTDFTTAELTNVQTELGISNLITYSHAITSGF